MADIPDYKLFYSYLDQAVVSTRSSNAAGFVVPGYPYLRANRFLYEVGRRARTVEERVCWVDLMRRYDVRARTKEIQVLPERSLKRIHAFFGVKGREKICEYLHYYSSQYLDIDRQKPGFYKQVKRAVRIPQGYSRVNGAPGGILGYPFVACAVRRQQHKVAARHKQPLESLRTYGTLATYVPQVPSGFVPVAPGDILRDRAGTNPLQIPEPGRERLESLAWTLAPVVTVDIRRDDDKLGDLSWKRRKVSVDTASAALYYYGSYTFMNEEPCLQINYALWFPATYSHWSPFLTRMRIDGLILRVTLAPDGIPVMLDGINACGSSYFCAPRKSRVQPVKSRFFRRGPFVPSWLPEEYPSARLGVRIGSAHHLLEHIDASRESPQGIPYALRPYKRLEMLPRDDGSIQSVFNDRGVMKGSGEIIQRGKHVTKLSGRDPFTDPTLFERTFVIK